MVVNKRKIQGQMCTVKIPWALHEAGMEQAKKLGISFAEVVRRGTILYLLNEELGEEAVLIRATDEVKERIAGWSP